MAREAKVTATTGANGSSRPLPMTLADLLAEDSAEITALDVPTVGLLPMLDDEPGAAIRRSPRSLPIPDLSALARVWLTIGEGGNGKTTWARYFADQLSVRGMADRSVLATIAPGNRALASYMEGVMQPDRAQPRDVAEWTHKFLLAIAKHGTGATVDSGGGDLGLSHLVRREPDLPQQLEERGQALIAAYFFSPRVDDTTFLASFEAAGFKPRATALVCNLARADSPAAFDDVRRQPAYKAALDRGAVELWMPVLPQEVALAIERRRLNFTEAASAEGGLKMWDRSEVARWLEAMARELEPVATWLPWA